MPYILALTSSAQRDFASLDPPTKSRVSETLDQIASNPRPRGYVKLVGRQNRFRVRVGHYRVVYTIDDKARSVLVDRIQHRREVYRR